MAVLGQMTDLAGNQTDGYGRKGAMWSLGFYDFPANSRQGDEIRTN